MKKILIMVAVGIFLAMSGISVHAYQAPTGPTELIFWNPSKTYNSYVLFAAVGSPITYMIDMAGEVVHTWPKYGEWAELLDNGNILSISAKYTGIAEGIAECDWEGNLVWEYTGADLKPNLVTLHHDKVRIFNTNLGKETTLIIAEMGVPYEVAVANGADPECNIAPDRPASADWIIEVDMDNNIVWKWDQMDHIVQDYDPTKLNYGDPGALENRGRLDMNAEYLGGHGIKSDWNHFNAMDYNPTLDQIVLSSRIHSEFVVLDHSLSTEEAAGRAGDYIYRWGSPYLYGQGDLPTTIPVSNGHQQLFGQHDIQWIDDGLPGGGNFLVFENGQARPTNSAHSSIYEINPYDGPMENGVYIWQMDAGYRRTSQDGNLSNQVAWRFNAPMLGYSNSHAFYSQHQSQANRLPNGNTFICPSEDGNFMQVTYGDPAANVNPEIVWCYILPITQDGNIVKNTSVDVGHGTRARQILLTNPGLAGRVLTPMGTITGRTPIAQIQDKLENFLAQ